MKHIMKGFVAVVFFFAVTNCAQKNMNGQITTPGLIETLDDGREAVTIPLEFAGDTAKAPSNNLPLEKADIPSELITLLSNTVVQEQPAATGGGFLGNLFGGLFAGGGMSGGTCGTLSSILSIGASFLTGGNPILGMIVPQIADSLLKCGSNSSLVNLIPQGASDNQQVFALISQIMQAQSQGKDPFALLNGIKNPQDLSSIIGIVSTLVGQTGGNTQMQGILSLLTNFQSQFGGSIGQCSNMNAMACQVFQIINQLRSENGLKALLPSVGCILAAQDHSKDMFENSIFTHISSNGTTAKDRFAKYGLKAASENIVRGDTLTAKKAVEMWMSSQGHKNNILSSAFSGAGVGYINGYFTQCFTK